MEIITVQNIALLKNHVHSAKISNSLVTSLQGGGKIVYKLSSCFVRVKTVVIVIIYNMEMHCQQLGPV